MSNHYSGIYTLCFLRRNNQVLLLLRNKQPNAGKYNGVGGKVEFAEPLAEAMCREVREETGLIPQKYSLRAVIRFIDMEQQKDYMVFTWFCDEFTGEICSLSDEGQLLWVDREKMFSLPLVENIPDFYPWLEKAEKFPLHFCFLHYPSENRHTFSMSSLNGV
jgi:8-oxo-dGTP diphosphatase